jgi:serine-type D-Ala-D-Ala carboxypeptidase (penicillin-binding protein 5/6)
MSRPRPATLMLRWSVLILAVACVGTAAYLGASVADGAWEARVVQEVPASYTIPGPAPQIPWPQGGQAVLAVDGIGTIGVSGDVGAPQPIASVAKVLTAYQVLLDHPLAAGDQGPTITVLPDEAAQYWTQVRDDESLVPVAAGEQLTEDQALEALMLPSADNIAQILARWDAGSVPTFLDRENRTAARLGMAHSHYTDPSGLDPGTVSTAPDQLLLEAAAMAQPVLAGIVGEQRAVVPVAGAVPNTNRLLGRDGVVGVKTGSTMAAGGCLMFAADVPVAGGPVERVLGVVLGQGGTSWQILPNALGAADRLIVATRSALTTATVATAGRRVATVRQKWSADRPVTTADTVSVVGWPGLSFRLAVRGPVAAPVLEVADAADPADHSVAALHAG